VDGSKSIDRKRRDKRRLDAGCLDTCKCCGKGRGKLEGPSPVGQGKVNVGEEVEMAVLEVRAGIGTSGLPDSENIGFGKDD